MIPDHEHLLHAERTPEWGRPPWQKRYGWKDAFGSESYRIGRWTEIVLDQLARNEARGALSTMIVRPITMWLCDRFGLVEPHPRRARARPDPPTSATSSRASPPPERADPRRARVLKEVSMLQPLSRVAVVIVRTKNVGDVVDQALAALHAQTFRDVELHVIDSGSTDGTLGIVRRWPCQLTCIEPKQYFPGSVLNEAIARTDAGN